MNTPYTTYFQSPVGTLKIITDDNHLLGLDFVNNDLQAIEPPVSILAQACVQQLVEYFDHTRQSFDLPLSPKGTNFQKLAWTALQTIPYGQTTSYGDQAKKIGNTKAVRAIGHANSKNPIAIIIPCHRVIGKNGKLTGYAGELWRKEWLLKHEQKVES
jgi:methylated-DNA-[protein]-cysteine S-methyltransferase